VIHIDPAPPDFSVVILSRYASNLIPCVQAVRANEPWLPPARIIVVDDGARAGAESSLPEIQWLAGEEPFIFARNANIGARKADGAIILLNDDALLMTPLGLTAMARTALASPDFGIISATTNIAGNPAQQPAQVGLREDTHVAFVCALISRKAWEVIGLLDERYCLDYGVEDRDYCRRVCAAGLKVGIFDGCFVDHAFLRSTFRGHPTQALSFAQNYSLYLEKWGGE
jgi:GT2 family glycosyltransferase